MSDREDSTQTGKSKTPEFASPTHEEFHHRAEQVLGKNLEPDLDSPAVEVIEPQVAKPTPEQARPAPVGLLQLRLWPEEQRAVPSYVFRSALFSVVRRGRRRFIKGETLAIWKGAQLSYEGWQLDQGDLDVWMEACHRAAPLEEGKSNFRVYLHERDFLRSIGRQGGGSAIAWLRQSIGRLQVCGVNLSIGSVEYQGPLISKFVHDKVSGRYVLYLHKELVDIFQSGYTRIQLTERQNLKSEFAKWLHSYVESHRSTGKPHQIGLQALQGLCGSEANRPRKFKEKIVAAMNQLLSRGIVEKWEFTGEEESTLRFFPRKPAS